MCHGSGMEVSGQFARIGSFITCVLGLSLSRQALWQAS